MQSNARAFFAGDTAYCPTFEIIGKEYGPFDFAAIPTGAYEPRSFMANYHCTPEEAVYIHQDVQSKQSLAICWGTFLKGLEPWSKPMIDLRDAKKRHGVKDSEFVGCKPGSSYLINTAREMAGSFEEIKREDFQNQDVERENFQNQDVEREKEFNACHQSELFIPFLEDGGKGEESGILSGSLLNGKNKNNSNAALFGKQLKRAGGGGADFKEEINNKRAHHRLDKLLLPHKGGKIAAKA